MPLMRPRQGRWLTGVCKGIALHLGIGVAWIRIAFIALTFLYGAGIIAYVFLWVFMPAGDPVTAAARTVPVDQAPLARGNQSLAAHDDESAAAPESLSEAIQRAPKPAVVALAGFALMATGLLLTSTGADVQIVLPLLVGLGGIALAWMNLSPRGTQLLSMLGGIALIFMGWALYVHNVSIPGWGASPRRIVASGFMMIVGIVVAVMPWANAMLQRLTHEQALKECEEERADMTAHLHDGVLQTLALIQLHSEESTTVFALARSQERELREWLYQERSTSDRSVGAGLKQIAAEVRTSTASRLRWSPWATRGRAPRPMRCWTPPVRRWSMRSRMAASRCLCIARPATRWLKCSCATMAKASIWTPFRPTGWASANRLSAASNGAAVQWR